MGNKLLFIAGKFPRHSLKDSLSGCEGMEDNFLCAVITREPFHSHLGGSKEKLCQGSL